MWLGEREEKIMIERQGGAEKGKGGGMDVELMNKVGTDLDLDFRFYSEKAQVNHEHKSFDSQNG